MTEVEKIAGKLTAAQREAIADAQYVILGSGCVARYRNRRAFPGLVKKGLLEGGVSQRLTALGIAVRAHLKDTAP